MNAAELSKALYDAKREVDLAFEIYREAIAQDAICDDKRRRAMARATISCREQQPKATVGVIEAMVDLETADVQMAARLAEGLKRTAGMAVDAKKQWMTSLQSIGALARAEAQISAWEPRATADA